jgi:hypothetical protein
LNLLSRPRRPRRATEWSPAKAVTFIVTLAASRSVTLAARAAGISRKSAYALKSRDPLFASAWAKALAATRRKREGNKVEEVEGPRVSNDLGDKPRRWDAPFREDFYALLGGPYADSPALARRSQRQ